MTTARFYSLWQYLAVSASLAVTVIFPVYARRQFITSRHPAVNTHPTTKYLAPVNSGSSTVGWITFAAYPSHTPVLDGGNAVLPVGGLINIRNKEYIRISGLTVQNVDDNAEGIGIYVENSRHIIIEKNHAAH